jgi:HEAT repeat protein
VVQLRPLVGDPDPTVRRDATEAIERIHGDRPRHTPANWWDDDEPALPTPPPVRSDEARVVPPPAHTAPPSAPLPEPEPEPPAAERQLPAPAVPLPPEAPPAPEPISDAPWDGTTWAGLPTPLPSEARALTKLLGMVAPADHPTVVEALRAVEPGELADLLGRYSPGADRALGRGLALAMGYLARGAAFSKLRHMVRDPHPTVRAASAQAIGEVGAASAIPLFQALLADPDEDVRAAGVRALSSLCRRIGRQDMARDYIHRMGDQPAPVADAIAEARAELDT